MEKSLRNTVMALALAGLGSGCVTTEPETAKAGAKAQPHALAVLTPASNSQVKGRVTFVKETEGIRVTAEISGLTPGLHGFHIHEKGDCSAPDATSAGGHFNPTGAPHGAPTDPMHHIGDFGNLEANQEGVARFNRVFQFLSFEGTNSIIGKAMIVHAKPDDLKTQPTGDAGARVACGVIEKTAK